MIKIFLFFSFYRNPKGRQFWWRKLVYMFLFELHYDLMHECLYHSTCMCKLDYFAFVNNHFRLLFQFSHFFRISNFFDKSITEETWLVQMCMWCIQIVNVLVLHFNHWVEVSAGGLLVPESLYSSVAKFFGTCLKIGIWIKVIF
jgi:hypothetical protein